MSESLKDVYREQLHKSIGGWSGSVIAAVPTVVFVVANSIWSLRPAIAAAVASALLLAGYRVARKQSPQQALSGLLGVVIAAVIAGKTGSAKGYFLPGIIISLAYAVPPLVSVLIRRPLVGYLWEFLEPTPGAGPERRWHTIRPLLRAYTWATLIAGVVFLARGLVQLTLYLQLDDGDSATGWLAVAKIAMGFPLFVVGVLAAFWIVRRARTPLTEDAVPKGGLAVGEGDEQ